MPSTKPFVIAYIGLGCMDALRAEAQLLTELAAFYRSEGFVEAHFGVPRGRVQPGQVAGLQIEDALARWPSIGRLAAGGAARPVRQRWLLEPTTHRALHRCAATCGSSLSDLAARMVQPLEAKRARSFDVEDAGLQFAPPAWAQAVARERLRQARRAKQAERRRERLQGAEDQPAEAWPWRALKVGSDDAKRAYRQWVLACHPDRGGDHDHFVLGKQDFERMGAI